MRATAMRQVGWWKTKRHSVLVASMTGLMICLLTLYAGGQASAQEFTLHVEPAAAIWLDTPQSDRFTPGFYGAIRPGISLGRVVGLQWTYAMLFVPSGDGYSDDGTAHFLMTGIRVRPFGTLQRKSNHLGGLFADANIGYVRTGKLNRLGLDFGLGYGFHLASWFSLGPVLRYTQVFQSSSTPNVNSKDAKFLSIGLVVGFGAAPKEEKIAECPEAPECVPEIIKEVVLVPEAAQPEPASYYVSPIDPCSGEPLVVVVQFKYDSDVLPLPRDDDTHSMDPVLDAVAEAIAQDPSCRVCIIGHASEEGPAEYNLDLSRKRAAAVQAYLATRGVEVERIPATGMGARCQLSPESSRSLNRRVEFLRLQDGESCPSECVE